MTRAARQKRGERTQGTQAQDTGVAPKFKRFGRRPERATAGHLARMDPGGMWCVQARDGFGLPGNAA